ncbi:MAG: hypothetical protein AB7S98_00070 [Burkholderiaceae bacterium]
MNARPESSAVRRATAPWTSRAVARWISRTAARWAFLPAALRLLTLAALLCAPGTGRAIDAPQVGSFPYATQPRAAAMQHWTVIADDIAEQVVSRFGAGVVVHVAPVRDGTPFETALAEFLVTSFARRGAVVMAQPEPVAYRVEFRTMAATHYSNADTLYPGALTLLSAGVLVLREVVADSWRAGLMATGIFGDTVRHFLKPGVKPRNEIAVTTSVVSEGAYQMRKTDVYYFDSADFGLYGTSGRVIRVRGGD